MLKYIPMPSNVNINTPIDSPIEFQFIIFTSETPSSLMWMKLKILTVISDTKITTLPIKLQIFNLLMFLMKMRGTINPKIIRIEINLEVQGKKVSSIMQNVVLIY